MRSITRNGNRKLVPLGLSCLVALTAGCANNPYMPLEIGNLGTYTVRTGFSKSVEPIEVRKVISVGGGRGFTLTGPLGESRIAWKNGVLIASKLSNATLSPAIPLLAPDKSADKLTWSGTVSTPSETQQGSATLTQSKTVVSIGGRKFNIIRTLLLLDTPKRQVELESDFAPNVGLVRQQQRTNGKFDIEIELLSGK